MTRPLSPEVGETLPRGEIYPPGAEFASSILYAGCTTAYGESGTGGRHAHSLAAANALAAGAGECLGRPVVRRADRITVVVASKHHYNSYAPLAATGRHDVIWSNYKPNFAKLRDWCVESKTEVLIIDSLQSIDPAPEVMSILAHFNCAVLVTMQGNETKPGVQGGLGAWGSADIKLWFDPKSQQVEAVSGVGGANPWPLPVAEPPPLMTARAVPATPASQMGGGIADSETARVLQTAQLALELGYGPDAGTAFGRLNRELPDAMRAIWGDTSLSKVLPALGRQAAVWTAAYTGQPLPAPGQTNF